MPNTKPTYWQRVKDYRYDPFMCEAVSQKPLLEPACVVWVKAFWYALFNSSYYTQED